MKFKLIEEKLLNDDFDVSYDDSKRRIKSGTTSYQRSTKYGVGKQMGNQIYVHKNYVSRVIDKDIYDKAVEMLNKKYPDFTFNTVMYDTKKPYTVRFDETKGFDREREPIVGNFIRVDLTKPFEEMFETGSTSQIFHHKWMWVDDDYTGFDVDKSYEWSKQWLSKIHKPSGYLDKWNKALDDTELERDS